MSESIEAPLMPIKVIKEENIVESIAVEKPKRKYTRKVKIVEDTFVVPAEVIEESVVPEPVVEEPVLPQPAPVKEKKPRTQKQIEAFEKARASRMSNISKIKNDVKQIVEEKKFDDYVVDKAISIKKKQIKAKKIMEELTNNDIPPQHINTQPAFVFV